MPFSRSAFPLLMPGMFVGLMGGTYDPPHGGHLYFAKRAVQALNFHKVVLLLSNNPHKEKPSQDLEQRFHHLENIPKDPRITVTMAPHVWAFENILFLKRRYPGVRFVWMMGADSLESFHLWKKWRNIIKEIPILVFPRRGYNHNLCFCRAVCYLRACSASGRISSLQFLRGCVLQKASSTFLRGKRMKMLYTSRAFETL